MGLPWGRTVKWHHVSLSALCDISRLSHFCVLPFIWALKIEDGKESMKEEERGEEEGRGLPAQGAPTTQCVQGSASHFSFLSSVSWTCAGSTQTCFRLVWSNPGKWPGFFICKITWRWLEAWNKITCMKPLAYRWNAQQSLNIISLNSYYFTLLRNRGKWGSYPHLGMKTWAGGTLRRQWAPCKWRPCQPLGSMLHQARGQLWSRKASWWLS